MTFDREGHLDPLSPTDYTLEVDDDESLSDATNSRQ
jgi:hypothetical protein